MPTIATGGLKETVRGTPSVNTGWDKKAKFLCICNDNSEVMENFVLMYFIFPSTCEFHLCLRLMSFYFEMRYVFEGMNFTCPQELFCCTSASPTGDAFTKFFNGFHVHPQWPPFS